MRENLSSMNKPVLIFSVVNDALVDSYNADEIDQWTRGPSSIVTLDKADHILSDKTDAKNVAEEIVKWFKELI